jgi:nitrogen fixation/metabolism regulation signal transduction histidine kinase
VRPLVEDARVRAPDAAIALSADNDAVVSGDPEALERVLRNLIENALAAIKPNGRIDVQMRRRSGYAEAHIADDGRAYGARTPTDLRALRSTRFPARPATASASPSPAASTSNTPPTASA